GGAGRRRAGREAGRGRSRPAAAAPAHPGVRRPEPDEHTARTRPLLLAILLGRRMLGGRGHGKEGLADGEGLSRLHVQPRDGARVGGGYFQGGFRRLHFDDRLVDRDGIADVDEPADDVRIRQPFPEVGEEEDLLAHASSHCRSSTASRIRSTEGRLNSSRWGGGNGMSKPVTRRTGAAREWKQFSLICAAISEETLAKPGASATTTARPVERTAAKTVSASKGTMERRSTTCRPRPSLAATPAASRATGTDGP